MGCVITKEHYHVGRKLSLSPFSRELEPTQDGGKKKQVERTLSPRQSKVITDRELTCKYDIKGLLGVGTFSDVFVADDKSTRLPYAVKHIELRSLKTRKVFNDESAVLQRLTKQNISQHENIVKLKEIVTTKFSAYIVMELCTGGDLLERIINSAPIEEKETARITKMILSAVQYLHQLGITHRDLKPENILFYKPGANSRIVITDFGFASSLDPDAVLSTYCGTLQYCSPELMLGKEYSSKADIWAVGVITYYMLSGHLPFHGKDMMMFREKITRSQQSYSKEIWSLISPQAKDFIDLLLEKTEAKRCTAITASKHEWFDILPKSTNQKASRRKHHRRHGDHTSISKSISTRTGKHSKYCYVEEFDHLPSLCNTDKEVLQRSPSHMSHEQLDSITEERRSRQFKRGHSLENLISSPANNFSPNISRKTKSNDSLLRRTSLQHHSMYTNHAYDNGDKNHLLSPSPHGDDGDNQFVIPTKYSNKRVAIEDLFNTTTTSSCDYTSCATSIPDQDMSIDEEPKEQYHGAPKEQQQQRHHSIDVPSSVTKLPQIYKRSLSGIPFGHDQKYTMNTRINGVTTTSARQQSSVISSQHSWKFQDILPSDLDKSNNVHRWITSVSGPPGLVKQENKMETSNRISYVETLSKSL